MFQLGYTIWKLFGWLYLHFHPLMLVSEADREEFISTSARLKLSISRPFEDTLQDRVVARSSPTSQTALQVV